MNILFLTLTKFSSIEQRGIYTDLIRRFHVEGHHVFVVSPRERREKGKASLFQSNRIYILNVKTLNLQKTNFVEKGIGTLLVEYQFLHEIKKRFSNIKFDLVLYSTPPITFSKITSFFKKRDKAFTYLLLKDIFPQNAVDMGMIKEGGLLHRYFQNKERKLYEISDMIGCMSDANRNYLLEHYPYLDSDKIEVNPNAIELIDASDDPDLKIAIRKKCQIPPNATVFLYGGNLGVPQGVDFLLETLSFSKNMKDIFFLIVGSGTQFKKVKKWFDIHRPVHARLFFTLPKDEFDQFVSACDVGLIFLDKRFTIPNFPSRLLSYLENKMPVLAATDPNTDIGKVIESYKAGFWVHAGNITAMIEAIKKVNKNSPDFELMRENAFRLLTDKYTVDRSYNLIMNKINHV